MPSPLESWFPIPSGSHFSLANIPFGIITHTQAQTPRPAVAIGDYALDLAVFSQSNGFRHLSTIQPHARVFNTPTLNSFAALGRPMHSAVRKYIQSVFLASTPFPEVLKDDAQLLRQCLIPRSDVTMHIPMQIGDYTDFFVGMNHAYNAGSMFRGPENALSPNYMHLPVGYHGRASSVVVSGTPIRRPRGQILPDPTAKVPSPVHGVCERLDMELELAMFICKPSKMGEPVRIENAEEHIFGFVLMNDWSARDVQLWEAVPLGPFNAKNFGTTVSAWVVLAEALDSFRVPGQDRNGVPLLAYMQEARQDRMFDINLAVELTDKEGVVTTVSRTSSKHLLFSFPQFIAHHTSTGCPLGVGDLMASGTISGLEPDSLGCFLESTKNGKETVTMSNGEKRTYLLDGDKIVIKGVCGTDETQLVGFGECTGTILPALTD